MPNPMESDAFQPTIIDSSEELASQKPLDVSQAKVGFVEGTRPQFADETAALLRDRLRAATLVLSIILALAFVGNLFTNYAPLIGVRAVILAIMVGAYALLRSRRILGPVQLRWTELVVFGALVLQLLLMMRLRIAAFARAEDLVSAVSAERSYLAGWSVLIFLYGVLMPNTWKRSLAVLFPTACLPYAMLFWMRWQDEGVSEALAADSMGSPLPIPFVAVLVSVFGSYTINSIRREAFKARQLGQYRLKKKLGAGGMGEVHRAEHQLLKRPCAIKLIQPSKAADATALARFEREVQATAKLTHWNTVEIFDYGHSDDGTFYYVMELLPGQSLEDIVRLYGPLPPERAVHFLRQACNALREAHAKGLIHRDIKPANVFAAERGGIYDVAKVLDFGLVRERFASNETAKLTQEGTFSGSPLYMCPEQMKAYDKLDARSDIYSLGAVAYYLLTGRPPFVGNHVMEIVIAHSRDPVEPPSHVNRGVPADVEKVILTCLEKLPEDRYENAESLERALADCECAGKWSEDDARTWWQDIDRRSTI